MKYTAQNTPFLAAAKAQWNTKIYRETLNRYNQAGLEAAANYLQQYTTAPIPGATRQPPTPLPDHGDWANVAPTLSLPERVDGFSPSRTKKRFMAQLREKAEAGDASAKYCMDQLRNALARLDEDKESGRILIVPVIC